ncbi:MAG: FAD:protein transferase [Acidimicrobiaceae bacterium]|jgi:thiamine biosynthesis lipoprotein
MVVSSERSFRIMGSDAHVIVVGGPEQLAEDARRRLFDLEQRWSRFLPNSEVNLLNDHAGEAVFLSAETVLLVERAMEAWRITGGAFDPTVLGAVMRAGYDRSFEELGSTPVASSLVIGCTDIVISGSEVRLPAGTGFDPGGIGKGLAADLVAIEVMAAGADGVCINLGGDLRVLGTSPDGAWTIAVEHPSFAEPISRVGLEYGAIATSTTLKRRWLVDGEERHHLIDPHTGMPSTTDLTLATVIAGEAWIAEVMAKAVLLRGSDRAFDLIDEHTAALVVGRDGEIVMSEGFAAFIGVEA